MGAFNSSLFMIDEDEALELQSKSEMLAVSSWWVQSQTRRVEFAQAQSVTPGTCVFFHPAVNLFCACTPVTIGVSTRR